MRIHFRALCLLFATAITMASCLNSDDDTVTFYDDAAITSFALSSAKMTMHTTSSQGKDSTYVVVSTTVNSYNFIIDQLKGLIYNVDSLPVGTDPTKILCTYTTKNNSFAAIKSMTNDSLAYFSTSDSIDFSKPRTVTVFSSSGLGKKDYTISVNIHKEKTDTFKWRQYPDCSFAKTAKDMKSFYLNGNIVLLASDGEKTSTYSLDAANGRQFINLNTTLATDAWKNALVNENILYVLDGKTLKKTTNGQQYDTIMDNAPIDRLIAASTKEIYGLDGNNNIMVSKDKGQTWNVDIMDSDSKYVPTDDISYIAIPFKYDNNSDYVLLAGNNATAAAYTDSTAFVWSKTIDKSIEDKENKWTYYNYDSNSKSPLKSLDGLTMVCHGNYILALGGKGLGACKETAHAAIYFSLDNGLTWHNNDTIVYPYGFDKYNTAMAVCSDKDNYIWIVCNNTGQVWKGRMNEVAWQ